MSTNARRLLVVCALVAVSVLALAPAALGNSSVRTYGGKGGNVQALVQPGADATPTATAAPSGSAPSTGVLPFTGTDVALAGGGAAVLLGAGAAMAMLATRMRRRETAD